MFEDLDVFPATPQLKSWSSPASTAELLSERSVFLPVCPLKALCTNKPLNPASPSFHLRSLWALWKTLCVPISSYIDYLGAFTSPPVCLPLNLSLAQPCELVTLSVLSIWAYHPRDPERITFLTSPRQMFIMKINATSSLHIQSHHAFIKKHKKNYAWVDPVIRKSFLSRIRDFFHFPFSAKSPHSSCTADLSNSDYWHFLGHLWENHSSFRNRVSPTPCTELTFLFSLDICFSLHSSSCSSRVQIK